jgi:hypothetical protein
LHLLSKIVFESLQVTGVLDVDILSSH